MGKVFSIGTPLSRQTENTNSVKALKLADYVQMILQKFRTNVNFDAKFKQNVDMERDRFAYDELQENAKRLTAKLLPIYENQRGIDCEYKNTVNDVLKKLNDHDETLTLRELIYTTNPSSGENAAAIETLIKNEQRKYRQRSDAFVNDEYIDQPTRIRNVIHADRLEIRYMELTVRYLDDQWTIINEAVKRKKDNHRTQVEQYRSIKSSFSTFVHYTEDRRRNLKQERIVEMNRTHASYEKLKDRTYSSVVLENRVLTLMNEIETLEACYTLLTWLSPAEWKNQFDTDRLTRYELTRSDMDLTRENHEHYLNHLHSRTLDDYLKDVRLEPVPEMYWQSAEEFTRTLEKLEKKTIDRMMMFDMIKSRGADSKRQNDFKKHGKQVSGTKFQNNVLSMGDRIKKNSADEEEPPPAYGYIKTVTHDEEYFRILKTMADICRQLDHPDVDVNMPLKMFELIATHLDQIVFERNNIPNDQWERTDVILQMVNKRRGEMAKSESIRCNAVQQTIQREASKTYDEATKRTKMRVMPNRSKVPKQLPPNKPKKPTLNYEQQMYLKCFTYLSPKDVHDGPAVIVPEFKFMERGDCKDETKHFN